MLLLAFGIVIDDIVFPDGRTAMGVLGGGGPQAAFGMRLWANEVGLAANVGDDFPEPARQWLIESGIDTTGIRVTDLPTPRAWQITERDGRRTQVWRTPPAIALSQLRRSLDLLPDSYRSARAVHFGIHPDHPDLAFAAEMRRAGGVVSIATFKPADQRPPPEALSRLIAAADIFSPNLADAASLVGPDSPRGLARKLVEAGESAARLIALRLGEQGSLIAEGQTGQAVRIPAPQVEAVDTVGAGDAYCGGFVAGWIESHDLVTAGLYGAVAASFAVEQIGLPLVTDELRAEARRRLAGLEPLAQPTSL
jgi:sugar/nucleoside kinase (ribokinase family)